MFGPVLHVLRYRRDDLDALIDSINAAGYGLTFGLHTRIDETIARVVERIEAGNVYVNRNIIGATVGVQPFGGSGSRAPARRRAARSIWRASSRNRRATRSLGSRAPSALGPCAPISTGSARPDIRRRPSAASALSRSPLGARVEFMGPVGERNVYTLRRRGRIAALATNRSAALIEIGAILAAGNDAIVSPGEDLALKGLPPELVQRVTMALDPLAAPALAGVLFEGGAQELAAAMRRLAARPGPIVRIQALTPEQLAAGEDFDLSALVEEVAIATNTAAAGGNASLMAVGRADHRAGRRRQEAPPPDGLSRRGGPERRGSDPLTPPNRRPAIRGPEASGRLDKFRPALPRQFVSTK